MQHAPEDLFARFKHEYAATRKPRLLEVDSGWFLCVTGHGHPRGQDFQEALPALYTVAYALKRKEKAAGRDFKLSKLEGLWSLDPGHEDFDTAPDYAIGWTLCMRIPDTIGDRDLDPLIQELLAQGKPKAVRFVSLMGFEEGRCVQMLHVGPYDQEAPTLAAIREFMAANSLTAVGRHHEIYLSDPKRCAPEKLRTIIRIPVVDAF